MRVSDLLSPAQVILDHRAADKRRLVDELARRAGAATGVRPALITDALVRREQLGSTGMGGGIAMPHARLAVPRAFGLFARLRPAIDFEAIDNRAVDLVFLLLLPAEATGDNLNALACVARRLRAAGAASALRAARHAADAYDILTRDGEPAELPAQGA